MGVTAIVGAVVAVAGTAYSGYQTNRASQNTRAANRRAARIEAVRAQRERTQAIRQNRIASATILAQAGNAGLVSSSGVQGTLSAQGTSGAANLQFANTVDALNASRLRLLDRAAGAEAQAGIGQSVAQIGSTVGSTGIALKGG